MPAVLGGLFGEGFLKDALPVPGASACLSRGVCHGDERLPPARSLPLRGLPPPPPPRPPRPHPLCPSAAGPGLPLAAAIASEDGGLHPSRRPRGALPPLFLPVCRRRGRVPAPPPCSAAAAPEGAPPVAPRLVARPSPAPCPPGGKCPGAELAVRTAAGKERLRGLWKSCVLTGWKAGWGVRREREGGENHHPKLLTWISKR